VSIEMHAGGGGVPRGSVGSALRPRSPAPAALPDYCPTPTPALPSASAYVSIREHT
jgi:hypothetical protein